jgi:hypothetical protein
MKVNPLLHPKEPWLHVLVANESEACDRIRSLQNSSSSKVVARLIRGLKAKTTGALFDEFAAALQFPCYFGENWDALNDCLNDLEWLPGDSYVLCITNSNHALEGESPESLRVLLDLLAYSGAEWAKAKTGGRPRAAKAFHVILQCTQTDEPALRHKLQAARAAYSVLK